MKKRWLAGLMTPQYKKLPVTMKMWMQFNVMPRTQFTACVHDFTYCKTAVDLMLTDVHGSIGLRNVIHVCWRRPTALCKCMLLNVGRLIQWAIISIITQWSLSESLNCSLHYGMHGLYIVLYSTWWGSHCREAARVWAVSLAYSVLTWRGISLNCLTV